MNWSYWSSFSFGTLVLSVACSSSPTDGEGPRAGAGGAAAMAGAPSTTAGAPPIVGGSASGGASGGSAPVAGAPAVAGSAGAHAGGSSTGGSSTGGSSTGGSSTGGSSTGGSSAGGGGNRPVKPSAGCAKASAQVVIPNSLVGVPTGYTGKDPVPVVIAFHAAGNDNTSIQNTFKSSDLAKKYLMVYPNSTSATTSNKTGWSIQADRSRYLEVRAAISSQACVDENRIYATG